MFSSNRTEKRTLEKNHNKITKQFNDGLESYENH